MEYTAKLTKPKFIKIGDLKPAKHCYNLYGKIVELNLNEKVLQRGETIKVAEGLIGDETGVVRFKLVGEHCDNLKQGNIVAFRNGKSMVIDEHILLQMDRFGKVTLEKGVTIGNVNNTNNVSDEKWEKKSHK
jgi:ssDNA-binding replication factor A large subunit